jgi:hypothetical protein
VMIRDGTRRLWPIPTSTRSRAPCREGFWCSYRPSMTASHASRQKIG